MFFDGSWPHRSCPQGQMPGTRQTPSLMSVVIGIVIALSGRKVDFTVVISMTGDGVANATRRPGARNHRQGRG